jgi:flagellar hook-associated protein 1 FlgK
MAQQFADTVNQLLTSGNVSDGPPAQTGVPLFTYDSSDPTGIAASLAVSPSISGSQLAAIDPGPPEVANGIALALAGLADPQGASGEINGESFSEFYGDMASQVGSALSAATNQQQVQQSAVTQAQNLRQQASGVDLDQEAMTLVQFQQAYEANSKMVSVLDTLSEDLIDILTSTTT